MAWETNKTTRLSKIREFGGTELALPFVEFEVV